MKERFLKVKDELRTMRDERKNKENAYRLMQREVGNMVLFLVIVNALYVYILCVVTSVDICYSPPTPNRIYTHHITTPLNPPYTTLLIYLPYCIIYPQSKQCDALTKELAKLKESKVAVQRQHRIQAQEMLKLKKDQQIMLTTMKVGGCAV